MEKFTDWLVLREWEYIGGVEPPRKPYVPDNRPPAIDQNPTMMWSADSTTGKLVKLMNDLGKIDPQRAKWFAKMMAMPGNAHRIERLAAQITNVQDLLKLINTLEQRQRAKKFANAPTQVM